MSVAMLLESFHQGHSISAYRLFGAHLGFDGDKEGVLFRVYAPHAKEVYVMGSFNNWDPRQYCMNRITQEGVHELFIEGVKENDHYKYHIVDHSGATYDKSDPYAFYSELRPQTASVVASIKHTWTDEKWMAKRTKNFDRPVNIYEVYAGGWKHQEDGSIYTYADLEKELIPYVKENGFTHIEFMPLNEYPFDGSWGYQASGYYSVTSRYGTPKEFASLINAAHNAGIGVIMDMVPVHFVKDSHGLRLFDGKPLYEYPKEEDANSQWGTCNFDLWKEEVRSFLMSGASFWCDIYHIDGIRIDAVSNIIYWQGNKSRGTNEGAIAFIRRMNYNLSKEYPGLMMIAEDSSDFPKVTAVTIDGGLGFDYKWDLGWMNDTLKYYSRDAIYRPFHHHDLTFSMAYFYSEKFVLPLSHDEVVHGKKTIVDRMWGTYEQKFAQARNLYVYMMTHPGKKLHFMGNEHGCFREFDEKKELDWFILKYPVHDSFTRFFKDLNMIYLNSKSLFEKDFDYDNFKWIDADNASQCIYSYYRQDDEKVLVVVLNMTPTSYEEFAIGVPYAGKYTEKLNSEKDIYSGCNMCNYKPLMTTNVEKHGFENTLTIRVAPFAGIIFEMEKKSSKKKKDK